MARLSSPRSTPARVDGWRRQGDSIVATSSFDDFAAAMAFVNRVAEAAEAANHHPDILVHGWNKVRLTLIDALRGRAHRGRPRARARSSTRSGERPRAVLPLARRSP